MPIPFLAGAAARAGAMRAGAGRMIAGCTHFVPITDDHEKDQPPQREPAATEAVPRDQTED